jgi:hypothetical protein
VQVAGLRTHAGEHQQSVCLGAAALQHCLCKFRSLIPRVALQGRQGALEHHD